MHRFKSLFKRVLFSLVFSLAIVSIPAAAQEGGVTEPPCTHCACEDPSNPCFFAENPEACCRGIEQLIDAGIDVGAIAGSCAQGDPDHPCRGAADAVACCVQFENQPTVETQDQAVEPPPPPCADGNPQHPCWGNPFPYSCCRVYENAQEQIERTKTRDFSGNVGEVIAEGPDFGDHPWMNIGGNELEFIKDGVTQLTQMAEFPLGLFRAGGDTAENIFECVEPRIISHQCEYCQPKVLGLFLDRGCDVPFVNLGSIIEFWWPELIIEINNFGIQAINVAVHDTPSKVHLHQKALLAQYQTLARAEITAHLLQKGSQLKAQGLSNAVDQITDADDRLEGVVDTFVAEANAVLANLEGQIEGIAGQILEVQELLDISTLGDQDDSSNSQAADSGSDQSAPGDIASGGVASNDDSQTAGASDQPAENGGSALQELGDLSNNPEFQNIVSNLQQVQENFTNIESQEDFQDAREAVSDLQSAVSALEQADSAVQSIENFSNGELFEVTEILGNVSGDLSAFSDDLTQLQNVLDTLDTGAIGQIANQISAVGSVIPPVIQDFVPVFGNLSGIAGQVGAIDGYVGQISEMVDRFSGAAQNFTGMFDQLAQAQQIAGNFTEFYNQYLAGASGFAQEFGGTAVAEVSGALDFLENFGDNLNLDGLEALENLEIPGVASVISDLGQFQSQVNGFRDRLESFDNVDQVFAELGFDTNFDIEFEQILDVSDRLDGLREGISDLSFSDLRGGEELDSVRAQISQLDAQLESMGINLDGDDELSELRREIQEAEQTAEQLAIQQGAFFRSTEPAIVTVSFRETTENGYNPNLNIDPDNSLYAQDNDGEVTEEDLRDQLNDVRDRATAASSSIRDRADTFLTNLGETIRFDELREAFQRAERIQQEIDQIFAQVEALGGVDEVVAQLQRAVENVPIHIQQELQTIEAQIRNLVDRVGNALSFFSIIEKSLISLPYYGSTHSSGFTVPDLTQRQEAHIYTSPLQWWLQGGEPGPFLNPDIRPKGDEAVTTMLNVKIPLPFGGSLCLPIGGFFTFNGFLKGNPDGCFQDMLDGPTETIKAWTEQVFPINYAGHWMRPERSKDVNESFYDVTLQSFDLDMMSKVTGCDEDAEIDDLHPHQTKSCQSYRVAVSQELGDQRYSELTNAPMCIRPLEDLPVPGGEYGNSSLSNLINNVFCGPGSTAENPEEINPYERVCYYGGEDLYPLTGTLLNTQNPMVAAAYLARRAIELAGHYNHQHSNQIPGEGIPSSIDPVSGTTPDILNFDLSQIFPTFIGDNDEPEGPYDPNHCTDENHINKFTKLRSIVSHRMKEVDKFQFLNPVGTGAAEGKCFRMSDVDEDNRELFPPGMLDPKHEGSIRLLYWNKRKACACELRGWESSQEQSNGLDVLGAVPWQVPACLLSGAEDCGAGWGCMNYPRTPMDEGRGNLEYDTIEGSDSFLDEFRASIPFLCAWPFVGTGWCDNLIGRPWIEFDAITILGGREPCNGDPIGGLPGLPINLCAINDAVS